MSDDTIRIGALQNESTLEKDRRSLERYTCCQRPVVRVLARPSFQAYDAVVENIAMTGIGLLLDRPFEAGTLFAIQLQSRDAGFSGILTGTVKHASRRDNGKWLVGCSLSRSLTDDEVFSLLYASPAPRAPAKGGRLQSRKA